MKKPHPEAPDQPFYANTCTILHHEPSQLHWRKPVPTRPCTNRRVCKVTYLYPLCLADAPIETPRPQYAPTVVGIPLTPHLPPITPSPTHDPPSPPLPPPTQTPKADHIVYSKFVSIRLQQHGLFKKTQQISIPNTNTRRTSISTKTHQNTLLNPFSISSPRTINPIFPSSTSSKAVPLNTSHILPTFCPT